MKYVVSIRVDVTQQIEATSERQARERAAETIDVLRDGDVTCEPYRKPELTRFGAVEIDMVTGVWYLPEDWSEFTDDEVRAAWHLATPAGTPRPIDGGFGLRVLGDIRDEIEIEIEARGILLKPEEA